MKHKLFVVKLPTKKYKSKFLWDDFYGYLLGLKVEREKKHFLIIFKGQKKIGLYKNG